MTTSRLQVWVLLWTVSVCAHGCSDVGDYDAGWEPARGVNQGAAEPGEPSEEPSAQASDAAQTSDAARLFPWFPRPDASPRADAGSAQDASSQPAPADAAAQPAPSGSCCPDGACICRGSDPRPDTLDRNGPFRVERFTLRAGTDHGGGTVYFPADAEPPLSGVVMCPGFTARQSSIAEWGPFFASHGIVLVTMDTRTTSDQVPQRARGLLEMLADLKAENARSGSPLQGKLSADRFGLAGWSMGGGGTWIASAGHPELKSAITLAGHHATAGGARVASGSRVPTLMLAGARDSAILGGGNQSQDAFRAIPDSTPKIMYEMASEGHFSWGTPRTNGNASGRYVMAFEKVFLEGDTRFRSFLLVEGPGASEFLSNLD